MGTTSTDTWFDENGKAVFWENVPMRTVKKAFFKKGNLVRSLAKLVLNSVTFDFAKTAQGGAVIVPPDYTAIEFISPDGRIDYRTLLEGTLGNALDESIRVLETEPIPAWDKFSAWVGSKKIFSQVADLLSGCELQTIDGKISTTIGTPDFDKVTNMVSLLEEIKSATIQAHNHMLSSYQLDTASFGWKVVMYYEEGGSFSIGFIFRE